MQFVHPDSADLHFNYAMRETKNEESFCRELEFSNHGGRFDGFLPAFGLVGRIHTATDRETGRARGFSFVEMPNDDEAVKAIADLDGKELGGRNLKVNEARPKGERPPAAIAADAPAVDAAVADSRTRITASPPASRANRAGNLTTLNRGRIEADF